MDRDKMIEQITTLLRFTDDKFLKQILDLLTIHYNKNH